MNKEANRKTGCFKALSFSYYFGSEAVGDVFKGDNHQEEFLIPAVTVWRKIRLRRFDR